MILLIVNYASKIKKLIESVQGLNLETYVSIVGSAHIDLGDDINFIGSYTTPLEAISDALVFVPRDDIILHVFSEFMLEPHVVEQMQKFSSRGFEVVYSYFETTSKTYSNFLYPLIGASLGRPIPPPNGPMMISYDILDEILEDLISGAEFYNAYQMYVFLEASTTFRPIAGIYFQKNVKMEEKHCYHVVSSYIDFFPRWRVVEGEYPLEILNFPKFECPQEDAAETMRKLLLYLDGIVRGEITCEDVAKDIPKVYDLQERECIRKNLLKHKSEIVDFITKTLKLII